MFEREKAKKWGILRANGVFVDDGLCGDQEDVRLRQTRSSQAARLKASILLTVSQ